VGKVTTITFTVSRSSMSCFLAAFFMVTRFLDWVVAHPVAAAVELALPMLHSTTSADGCLRMRG
jgi:hypothetical protein